MSKKALVLLGIIGLIIIFILCALKHWRAIEEDVAQCSSNILDKSAYSSLTLDTHDRGRNLLISGNVKTDADKQKIVELLNNQCNMTGIENQIQVTPPPKPTKSSSLRFSFDAQDKLTNVTGTIGKSINSQNLANLFSDYPRTQGFDLNLISKNDVIPTDYLKYTSALLPSLTNVDQANVQYSGNVITLKGLVNSQDIKRQITDKLAKALGSQVKINNLLTVIAPKELIKPIVYKPLDAKDCQLELSDLLNDSMVHFNTGSAVITTDSTGLLDQLANTTKACQGVKVEIIGHTDKTGNEDNNIKLSHARASSVVKYLFNAGVQTEKLSANGVGSSQPITSNETSAGRSQNRRIEFKVHSL